ncbi:MAG: hypothetical protein R3F31_18780 [Verrucomicrobiales bacterium]
MVPAEDGVESIIKDFFLSSVFAQGEKASGELGFLYCSSSPPFDLPRPKKHEELIVGQITIEGLDQPVAIGVREK